MNSYFHHFREKLRNLYFPIWNQKSLNPLSFMKTEKFTVTLMQYYVCAVILAGFGRFFMSSLLSHLPGAMLFIVLSHAIATNGSAKEEFAGYRAKRKPNFFYRKSKLGNKTTLASILSFKHNPLVMF